MAEIYGICDERFMAVSYVMNQMLDQGQGDYRGLGIVMAAYEGLR